MKFCSLDKDVCHISFNMMWFPYSLIALHLTAKTPSFIGSHFTMQDLLSDQLIGEAF